MIRCYKKTNENNELLLIGTGDGGIEITKEEYEELLEEIIAKAELERLNEEIPEEEYDI